MKKLVNEDTAYIFHTSHYQQHLKRLKVTFNNSKLPSSPLGVYLPPRLTCSVFVFHEDFLKEINLNIQVRLDDCDTEDGKVRVPPLAVSRCSRGGKTRTLLEIANMMFKSDERQEDSLAVLLITFNDFMGLSENEKKEENMCQVFLRRVAFMATYKSERKFHKERDIDIHKAFTDFRKSNSYFDQDMFVHWFNEFNGEIVLIINELNNLTSLSDRSREEEAKEFGSLLKENFLCQTNRYFVFSSHVISSVSTFGLLYRKSQRIPIEGKRANFVKEFWNENKQDLTAAFEKTCRSLIINGSSADLSKLVEFLCDGVSVGTGAGEGLIRWIPYHLQFVMAYFGANHRELHIQDLAGSMAMLCNQMTLAKEKSGDDWEGLFILFLLARCIAKEPDGLFLPKTWLGKDPLTGEYPLIEYKNYDSDRVSSGTLLDQCTTWKELSEGIDLTEKPTVSILYPSHAQFGAYDAFVVYSVGDKKEVYGYQLKEGEASTDRPVEESL
ncbi:unknown protein [Seminavis robusta]|uniref:Uncharacterized protein n=1 Tax=Seminavis robusta TaxID=568900 RepID=A0A9N8EFV3_9STRA|nr:unknown protein [Seminavis robusta]|eukprot:Sro929_g221380.1 n/a (497) ;mRNA; f:39462-41096